MRRVLVATVLLWSANALQFGVHLRSAVARSAAAADEPPAVVYAADTKPVSAIMSLVGVSRLPTDASQDIEEITTETFVRPSVHLRAAMRWRAARPVRVSGKGGCRGH